MNKQCEENQGAFCEQYKGCTDCPFYSGKKKKSFSILDFFKRKQPKKLPPEGSIYTHNREGSAYNGMTGVVKHHNDGKHFMILCETSTLVNINP